MARPPDGGIRLPRTAEADTAERPIRRIRPDRHAVSMTFDDNRSQTPPPPPSPLSAPQPPAGSSPAPTVPFTGAVPPAPPLGAAPAPQTPGAQPPVGEKSFITTWLLSMLIGFFGADRFYLGKIGTGILKLVTFGGLGVWVLVDLIMVLTGATRDSRGNALAGYREHRKIAWIVTGAVLVIGMISGALGGGSRDSAPPAADPPAVTAPAEDETDADEPAPEPTEDAPVETAEPEPEPEVPAEYASALRKAETYSDLLHMSKQGIYDQLTSEYGEKFSAEAAQYAMDNLDADWNANALAKAKSYQQTLAMSPEAIRDQLTSEYGEKFTAEEADYAIAHLND